MQKRIFGAISIGAAALWPIFWEFVRSLFYERGSHMLTPFINSITMDQIVHWGPTVGLLLLGLWLFWKTRSEKTGDQTNFPSSPIGSRDYHWQFDSQRAVAIAARLRSTSEWQDKIIVDVTPEHIWNLFRSGSTTMEGETLTRRFLNKWMVICGPFRDVRRLPGNAMVVNFARRNDLTIVFMYFNEDSHDALELLIPNQKISVVGRIDLIKNDSLNLEDCKLVQ